MQYIFVTLLDDAVVSMFSRHACLMRYVEHMRCRFYLLRVVGVEADDLPISHEVLYAIGDAGCRFIRYGIGMLQVGVQVLNDEHIPRAVKSQAVVLIWAYMVCRDNLTPFCGCIFECAFVAGRILHFSLQTSVTIWVVRLVPEEVE